MKVHTLTIDSSQRQANVYPNPNSYTILLENPIYDVTRLKLVSARIPTPQLVTCATNRVFSVDGVDITLDKTNYTSGTHFASDLDTYLQPPITNIDRVYFDTATNQLTFSNTTPGDHNFTLEFRTGTNGYTSTSSSLTTPHQVMGFNSNDQTSVNKTLTAGAINFKGPNSLVMKVTAGSDAFNQSVYTSTPFYTGHILLDGTDFINASGSDDSVTHEFHSGPQKFIQELKIDFFYMSHGRLIPYDFMNQDHVLKFEIACSTDKLEGLPKVKIDEAAPKAEKPLISIPKALKNSYKWEVLVYIGLIVFLGILLISFMNKRV